jgi:UDP-N-acetylglucosamine/UDP-N-acetylgalactosamine diphosphorylase
MSARSQREQRLRGLAREAGQAHLFEDWERLDEGRRESYLGQLEQIDFESLSALRALLRQDERPSAPPRLEAPEVFPLQRDAAQQEQAVDARRRGAQELDAGRVGYVLVAGGQASRLGYDGPKGAFRIGPVSRRSLFEIHARRLLAVARRRGVAAPWYVMTSPANDAATREFFAQHAWFGLPREEVFFFSQAMLPAMDAEGRVLRSGPGTLFLAPNGHGGSLAALRASGALDDARARGLTQLSYFQVDNPLALPADELFLGLHAQAGAGMSSKVVEKRSAGEKVGVLGRIDGRMGCIEYSDLPSELLEARDERGRLLFGAGNIALHALAVDFVADLTEGELKLPWHLARKTMKVWEDGAEREVAGVKFETFVFDALARSGASVTLEVERTREFSPVKNREGEDSPDSTRADLARLHSAWVRAAGLGAPPVDERGLPRVEVCPLLAQSEEEFVASGVRSPRVVAGGHLYEAP